jgi:hypothetical protein
MRSNVVGHKYSDLTSSLSKIDVANGWRVG